jgi:hypothetical protein
MQRLESWARKWLGKRGGLPTICLSFCWFPIEIINIRKTPAELKLIYDPSLGETTLPTKLFGMDLPPEEVEFLQFMERVEGRELTPQEAHFSMKQARQIGELEELPA